MFLYAARLYYTYKEKVLMKLETFMKNEAEKPLDKTVFDGGYCSIFRTIGCVGDSLSSGEFEAVGENGEKTYHDLYEYSWGQYLARAAGCKVYNFSRGGMTAKEYCESFAEENGFWDDDKSCQAYIIALGVNELLGCNANNPEVGSISDVDKENYKNNKNNFAGHYAEIIQRYKIIQPDAKFFFVTMPRLDNETAEKAYLSDKHAELLTGFAHIFNNSYVIDLRRYAPVYDKEFREFFYLGGHLNPCGYILTAQMIMSYIDYIIRHNINDFKKVGFIGTPFAGVNG